MWIYNFDSYIYDKYFSVYADDTVVTVLIPTDISLSSLRLSIHYYDYGNCDQNLC